MRRLTGLVLALLPGMLGHAAIAAPPGAALTALYADPRQPDISGLWGITGAFYFAPDQSVPELLGEYKALYARRMQAFNAGHPIDDVTADCLPAGMPHMDVVPYPFEIMQTPGRVTILYEYDSVVRRIPIGAAGSGTTSGAAAEDVDPSYYGVSVGRWEGDTLIVETRHIRADTQVDFSGLPHSDALMITERLRRKDATTLENRITLDDSKAYAAPFTVTRLYKLHPKWKIAEYSCTENNRNRTDAQGRTTSGVVEQ
jgi:hypothetical protein